MPRRRRVTWWEPFRVTCRHTVGELRAEGLLSWKWWVRIWLVVILCSAVLILLARAWMPGVVLPWPQIVRSLTLGPLVLAGMMALHVFFPLSVSLRERYVFLFQGQAGTRIDLDRLITIEVVLSDDNRRTLNIRYLTKRGKERFQTFAISRKVDPTALQAMISHYNGLLDLASSQAALPAAVGRNGSAS